MTGLKWRSLQTIIVLLCVMLSVCGCASLAQKFVRKPKAQEKPVQAMVLAPESYSDSLADKADAYRHYLSLWSGWHDELINNLSEQSGSQRRELDNVQEAINNLAEMKKLLSTEKQAVAGGYLDSLNALKATIAKDYYGINRHASREQAESLKRQIHAALQYNQVKDNLR